VKEIESLVKDEDAKVFVLNYEERLIPGSATAMENTTRRGSGRKTVPQFGGCRAIRRFLENAQDRQVDF